MRWVSHVTCLTELRTFTASGQGFELKVGPDDGSDATLRGNFTQPDGSSKLVVYGRALGTGCSSADSASGCDVMWGCHPFPFPLPRAKSCYVLVFVRQACVGCGPLSEHF